MSYQVFARKYRPQTFDDVVGQEHITRTLKNAIAQNRLAHAYLFVGPRGTGKTSTARILAKCLCCVKAPTTEPCGVCDPCREIAAGISLDVLEIDGASNNGVEQVRELRDNVRYAPTRGTYKIYIIDEVHMLTSAAFNALLKTLEEPPEHVKFIFATTEPQKVLPTILSRCQRFDLRRIPAPLIAAHLQKIADHEQIALAGDAADAIARGAEGGLRDAESMLDQLVAFCGERIALDDVLGIFGFTAPETVARMAGHLLERQTSETLAVLDEQSEGGKDLLRLLSELIAHLRNLLVFQVNPASTRTETPGGLASVFEAQAALISTERLLELIDGFAAAENRMKWAPNKKLHFEIALIKAMQSLGQTTLTEVIDALTHLRETDSVPANGAGRTPSNGASPDAAAAPGAKTVDKPRMDWASLKKSATVPVTLPAAPVPDPAKPVVPSVEPALTKTREVTPATPPNGSKSAVEVQETTPRTPLDGAKIWHDLIPELHSQRPLITAWVRLGRFLSGEGDTFRVGFPHDQKMVVDSLNKPNNRKLLESLLSKLAGRSVGLKLELSDEEVPPVGSNGGSALAAGHETSAAERPVQTAPAVEVGQDTDDPAESFKNDPLIQKALKIFEGEIRSVERP